MKQQTKISRPFVGLIFAVILTLFLVPTVKAGDTVLNLDAGWYWSSDMPIPDHGSQAAPALAVFNDQLHMVSLSPRGKNLYHSYYNGILWSEEVRISKQSSQASPALAAYNGKLHIVYLGSNNTDIYHSMYDGNSWSTEVKVLDLTGSGSPAVAAFGGLLHMVYKSETSTTIYHSTYNGSSWTTPAAIPDQGTTAAPALAVYDNNLHMVHLGHGANDLWHSYYNGSSWSANVKILDFTTQTAPALAEVNGSLHMVHKSETGTDIYHSSYDGISWTGHGTIPNQAAGTAPALGAYNGTMQLLYPGDGSTDIYESFYVSQICAAPAYEPDFWNYYMEILRNNNCYNYSNNKRTDTFAQPGKAAGQMYTALTCEAVEPAAIADGILKLEGTDCPNNEMKIALVVAPDFDYHWYRLDTSGYWTHKPGAIPSTLIESELFGHERGAFTGAVTARPGRFELAEGGTLFLDEIGDLPGEVQAKLLRVLQDREVQRLGATRARTFDVRIVTATNRDLETAVAEGSFRQDLYYRISVFVITIPPLRDRREDIPILVWSIINRRQEELGRSIEKIPKRVMDALQSYSWPGNIRELENVIERALILSPGKVLELDDAVFAGHGVAGRTGHETELLDQVTADHITAVLERCNWRISGRGNAAEVLGLHPNTLRSRMKKLAIVRPDRRLE